jgi:hypothetical protein
VICALLGYYAASCGNCLPTFWDSWPVKMGPIRCPETSVDNYHTTPRNIQEECRSQMPEIKLLSMIGPFLHPETNQSHALSEKQMLQIALHCLGTGEQYHSVGDRHGVSKASVCIPLFISDRRWWGYICQQYRCRWLCLLLIYNNCLLSLKTVVTVQTFYRRIILS